MKKLGIIFMFIICIIPLYFAEAVAEEKRIFGPTWAIKEKGKAQESYFSFHSKPIAGAKYVLKVRAIHLRSRVKVVLNGTEVITRKTQFVDGVIEISVNLIDGDNELSLMVYKGEVAISVKAITPPATTRALYCAVIGEDGMIVSEGLNVSVQILNTDNRVLNGITGEDGFCSFNGLPTKGTAIINVLGEGVAGSEVVNLSSAKDHVTSTIHLYSQGPGKITGKTDANAIVQVIFQTPPDHPIPNILHKKSVMSDINGFFVLDNLPLKHFRLQVNAPTNTSGEMSATGVFGGLKTGSKSGKLSEAIPEVEIDIETKSPSVIHQELVNGYFTLGTWGWKIEGTGGLGWKPRFFSDEEGDPCNPDPDPDNEDLCCGAVIASGDYDTSRISQAFMIPEDASILECRIRYISEAYRLGPFSVNDDFSVRVETESGAVILAEGSENTYEQDGYVDISFGLIGMSEELPLRFDLESVKGEAARIIAEIRHSVTPFNSFLVIADARVKKKEELYFHSDYSLVLPASLEFAGGMVVELVFENTNPLLGTVFTVKKRESQQTQVIAVPPNTSTSVSFSVFGCEPIGWTFDLREMSILNQQIFCKIYSSWIPGMPENS